jgi:hypothetical protein
MSEREEVRREFSFENAIPGGPWYTLDVDKVLDEIVRLRAEVERLSSLAAMSGEVFAFAITDSKMPNLETRRQVHEAVGRALAARDAGAGVREEGFGPTVTVRRSCDDCKACVTESYVVQGDSGQKVRCAHPSLAKPKYIGDTSWETPQWCPALVDADANHSNNSNGSVADARDAGAVTDEMVMAAHRAMGEGWCYCYYGNPVDHRTGKLVPVLDAMLRKGLAGALGGTDANG